MGIFSKKEDTRYVKEFDTALSDITELAKQFREIHFESIEHFESHFQREKTPRDLEKERILFDRHLDVLQKLKFNTDLMLDEAFKLVRNETALTETDRIALRKLITQKTVEKTVIKVPVRKGKKR